MERWLTPSVVPSKGVEDAEKRGKDAGKEGKKVKDALSKSPRNPAEKKKKKKKPEEKGGGGISPAVVSGLRGKLQGLRERVRGQKAVATPPPWEERKSESIDVPSSGEEGSYPALEDALQTGMDLTKKAVMSPVGKADRGRKRRRRSSPTEAMVGTSGITTKNLQGQLASSAVAALQESKMVQKKRKKMSSAEKVGNALAKALAPLGLKKVKKEKKDWKKKKKKKKKGKKGGDPSSSGETSSSEESSTEPSDEDGEEESKSSEEFEAPMVKRSREKPGSVLELLVQHARAQLDQSSAVTLPSSSARVDQGIKILSYFQVILKPQLGNSSAPVREMFLIATVLDLLRKGHLSQVGDALAARFFALHQSQIDGHWQAAKHLEIHALDEATSTTTAVLLQTRRHAKMAAKAQGWDLPNGSWRSGWGRGRGGKGGKWKGTDGEWKGGNPKGDKGKGKGKKGKGPKGGGQGDQQQEWGLKEAPAEK